MYFYIQRTKVLFEKSNINDVIWLAIDGKKIATANMSYMVKLTTSKHKKKLHNISLKKLWHSMSCSHCLCNVIKSNKCLMKMKMKMKIKMKMKMKIESIKKILFEFTKAEVIDLIGINPIKIPFLFNIINNQSLILPYRISPNEDQMRQLIIPTFAICLSKRGLCYDAIQEILKYVDPPRIPCSEYTFHFEPDKKLFVFAQNYNILRAMSGLSSIAYQK
jgi:hypothetical protein